MIVEMLFVDLGEQHVLIRRLGLVFGEELTNQVLLSWSWRSLRSILACIYRSERQAKHAPFPHPVRRLGLDCIWPWRRLRLCCLHRLALHVSESAS